MSYLEVFGLFWKEVVHSAADGSFVKLTMAKTVGKPNLRNIFVRPVYSEGECKVLLKLRYRSVETEDQEDELTLEAAFEAIKRAIQKPTIKMKLSNCIPNADIEIGNHDDEFYIIRKSEYAT